MTDPFNILSKELSETERKALLARIVSSQAPAQSEEDVPPVSIEPRPWSVTEEYEKLSFVRKLILYLKCLFTAKPVYALTKELVIGRIRERLESRAPGLIDFHAGRFTPLMKSELETLKPAFAFLRSNLAGLTKRRDFIALVAGIELDPLNDQILQETDPSGIYREPHNTEERVIRAEMLARFDRLIEDIPREKAVGVYHDVQRLQNLDALGVIRIDDAISLFPQTEGEGPTLHELGAKLVPLCDVVSAAHVFPSAAAWNAVILHLSGGEWLEEPELDLEKESEAFMEKVRAAKEAIRSFSRAVPLTDILRFTLEDVTYCPKAPGGGEEWLTHFRSFWEDRLEGVLRAHSVERKKRSCITEALALFGTSQLPFLEHYRTEDRGKLFTARHDISMAIIRGFHNAVFLPKMDRVLKIVFINGDFYKEDNRAAFTDCYEQISGSYERTNLLDSRVSPDGDLGKRLLAAKAETETVASLAKLRSAAEEANLEARRITDSVSAALSQLSKILYGILYGEAGGPFDSLANLHTLGGKENKAILAGLDEAIGFSEKAAALISEVRDVENG